MVKPKIEKPKKSGTHNKTRVDEFEMCPFKISISSPATVYPIVCLILSLNALHVR